MIGPKVFHHRFKPWYIHYICTMVITHVYHGNWICIRIHMSIDNINQPTNLSVMIQLNVCYDCLLHLYGTCHSKVTVERSYERPFPFLLYARSRTRRTPIYVVVGRP